MAKKILLLLLTVVMAFSVCASAQDAISVELNGQVLAFDVPPQLINDRTMVPMRAIFENLGANVEWIGTHELIVATKGVNIITMKIGSNVMVIQDVVANEQQVIELDVPPQVINDRTLVPVRAIAEGLSATVEWVGETQTVVIKTK